MAANAPDVKKGAGGEERLTEILVVDSRLVLCISSYYIDCVATPVQGLGQASRPARPPGDDDPSQLTRCVMAANAPNVKKELAERRG